MSLEINKTVIKKVNLTNPETRQTIATIRIARDENGLKLYCKSAVFETYFQNLSGSNVEDDYEWCDLYPYEVNITNMKVYAKYSLDHWGNFKLFPDGENVQMAWLRSKNLKNGISIEFKNNPIHKDDYDKFVKSTIEFLERFYNDYVRPRNVKGRITSKLSGDLR